mgnify:CR=1 FL=1
MADNIKYRFIQNVGDYFPSGYFSDDFFDKVQKCAGISNDEIKDICSPYVRLKQEYNDYKNFIINDRPRVEDAIKKTHDFHTRLLSILGYETNHAYQEHYIVNDESVPVEMIPVRHVIRQGEQVKMLVMEMQNLIPIDEKEPAGLFEQQYESDERSGQQKYAARQWRFVFNLDIEKYKISPAIINKAITHVFLLPEERRPHFILMLAGNTVFLFDKDKWAKGSYLQFSLDDLFAQASIDAKHRALYALFHMLVSKHTLAAEGEMVLMDTIIEESYKNAYEVTKDLKEGVILAVETLANEALYWWKQNNNIPVSDYTDDTFESEVKDDCLAIIYRLLFLFYAESRDELEILPVDDEVYKLGYSLESLRDLEMVRLNSDASRNGYFFDDSIHHLFSLLSDGHNAKDNNVNSKSFRVRPIDSPLFNDKKLHHLAGVRIRNIKWQEIIKALSLSKKKNYCGRISYANLGVNQLGSVYESLLAFRGFYAEEDYIEVHKANAPQDGTFLVPYSRMGDFDISEVLCDQQTGNPVILPEGTFVYRLNGRDRQKSASYYTPEVLTRSTVKYTLKSILDDVRANKRQATELLELKILEPAMGAAAFQNEVINQLAEAYLAEQQRQQREKGLRNWRIQPDRYRDELQKVKAYIATHNVYGVDLNPTAIELGKLSLWLNVIHKDMETPFFANRLALGNAVIGAWLKVYSKQDIYAIFERYGSKPKVNKWWEKAPHRVKFFSNRVNRSVNEVYHFLLPDANMLGVRSIKEQKKAHANEDKHMVAILKDWTAPIVDADFKTLQRISSKIDVLLKEYFSDQISIDKYTNNRKEIWDGIDHSASDSLFKAEEQAESYAQKQQLFDTRYRHDNAYRKLKLTMDYWCALWFWEYEDAAGLPTREEYWGDIEALLDVDNSQLDTKTRQALERVGSNVVSEDMPEYDGRMSEDESQIVTKTQEEILTSSHAQVSLFADDEPLRLKIADRLSKRYHFFHPMLEFIEVFWLREGFDIICGNPPWLKLEFDEQGILSEKYPEVAIRKVSAPDARKMRDQMFEQIPSTEELYRSEEIDTACSSKFMSAYCNYPLLVGQHTNLYKCVLENCMDMASDDNGYIGLLTPESIYDDPKGQPLRRELYKRLRYHFQYQNELRLFAEVHHHTVYGDQLLGPRRSSSPRFASLSNLFHPSTVDACFAHDGHGLCEGKKEKSGRWNISGHKKRIVTFTDKELKVMSEAFEEGSDWESAKLVSIHVEEILDVIKRFSDFKKHVIDYNTIITEGLNETISVDKKQIIRKTKCADTKNMEMIFSGPHVFVANPYYKTPREQCILNSDYDIIDLSTLSGSYSARTNYIPNIPISDFRNLFVGFYKGQGTDGVVYDDWFSYYKAAFRRQIGADSERSLSGAIIPPNSAHIGGVVSVTFDNYDDLVEFSSCCSSTIWDFYVKILKISDVRINRINSFPLGIADKYKPSLFARTLLLNCLTTAYSDLWQEMWDAAYKQETWSIDDPRLKPFDQLHEDWSWDIPLRNYFERRQALVEIDVIAAMALGLTLEDLEMIYTIQFPVLQQNEADTWYDQKGNIVFTCSKGLTGVGLDRKRNTKTGMLGWEDIRGEQIDENTYAGTSPTHTHTIDPAKSELYGGQQVTYYAPYTKCDRIEDYRRAWAHFEKVFNK